MKCVVKAGVDLWLLAAWFYGDPALFDVIYFENQDLIGDDPEALSPGMTLEVPLIGVSYKSYPVPLEGAAA